MLHALATRVCARTGHRWEPEGVDKAVVVTPLYTGLTNVLVEQCRRCKGFQGMFEMFGETEEE